MRVEERSIPRFNSASERARLASSGARSSSCSCRRSAVSGVHSEGLRTIVFPAASAGPIFQMAIMSG